MTQAAQEITEITHELNNIMNTLNGYNELALEAKSSGNEEEYNFFKEKIVSTVTKKLPATRALTDRLSKLQSEFSRAS